MRDNWFNTTHDENWNNKFGNNMASNEPSYHDYGMKAKNMETAGGYQAKVSGDYGEYSLKSVMNSLPDCFHLLNDYLIQTKKGSTQLDHIMVCPWGIFVIETKNHKGYIFGDDYGSVWTQTLLQNGRPVAKNTFYSPIRQNQGHIRQLIKATKLNPKYIGGMVCFTSADAFLGNVKSSCTYNLEGLYQYFMSLTTLPVLLSDDVIYKAIKLLDETNTNGYINAEKHVAYVKEMQEKAMRRKRR